MHEDLFLIKEGLELRLRGPSGVIGKENGLEIQTFSSPFVSRRHLAWSRVDAECIEVADLGSRNGTFVGGRRLAVGERVLVELGGRVDIAHEGEWILTNEESRTATFMKGTPRAEIRQYANLEAEVRIFSGETLLLQLDRVQAKLLALLAEEMPKGFDDDSPAQPGPAGWVGRSECAETLYEEADVGRLNKVIFRLRKSLRERGLVDILEPRRGGGGRSSIGEIRLRSDGAWTFCWEPEAS